jgi:hypothetical protein
VKPWARAKLGSSGYPVEKSDDYTELPKGRTGLVPTFKPQVVQP